MRVFLLCIIVVGLCIQPSIASGLGTPENETGFRSYSGSNEDQLFLITTPGVPVAASTTKHKTFSGHHLSKSAPGVAFSRNANSLFESESGQGVSSVSGLRLHLSLCVLRI